MDSVAPLLLLYKSYTSDTATRVGSRPSRAIQLNSAIQYIQLYIAIYTIHPLQHPSACVVSARAPQRTYCIARIALVGRSSARPAGRDAGAGGVHLSLSLVSVVRVVAFGFYLVLLLCAPRMFIFAKRFSVTPTRNHYHHQLGCITSTDGRVKCVS